jgi:hypothetical protein
MTVELPEKKYTVQVYNAIKNDGTPRYYILGPDGFDAIGEHFTLDEADTHCAQLNAAYKNPLIRYTINNTYWDHDDADPISNIILEMNREQCVEFLVWNDPNGIYSDEDCQCEETPPLTQELARLLCLTCMWQNSGCK